MSKKLQKVAVASSVEVNGPKFVGAFVRTPNFLKEKIMKKFVCVFALLCVFSMFSLAVFAAKGPCFHGGSSTTTENGSDYDPITGQKTCDWVTSVTTNFDDKCNNTNENDCTETSVNSAIKKYGYVMRTTYDENGNIESVTTAPIGPTGGRKTC